MTIKCFISLSYLSLILFQYCDEIFLVIDRKLNLKKSLVYSQQLALLEVKGLADLFPYSINTIFEIVSIVEKPPIIFKNNLGLILGHHLVFDLEVAL